MEDLVDFLDPLFMNVLPISVRFMFLNTGQKLIFCGRLHTVPVWGCGSLTLYARPDHCVKKATRHIFYPLSLKHDLRQEYPTIISPDCWTCSPRKRASGINRDDPFH